MNKEKKTCLIEKDLGEESKSNKISSHGNSNQDSSIQANNKGAFESDAKKAANVDKKEVSTQQKEDNSKVKDDCSEICQNRKPTQDVGVYEMNKNLGHQKQYEENLKIPFQHIEAKYQVSTVVFDIY